MPVLATHVAAADDPGGVKAWVLAGLGLSWVGDVALLGEGDDAFVVGLGSFLVAHACYLAALSTRRAGGVRRAPALAAGYGVGWLGLNLILLPRTGRFRLPVLVYGTALTAMALAALETGSPSLAAGGAAFLVSDGILALDTFGAASLPRADALVMLTYTVAQVLIATGLTSSAGERRRRNRRI
jgi:uncharacterized membrane protein YhhN